MRTFLEYADYRKHAPDEGQVYHKDVGLPNSFEKPKPGMYLRYALHARDQAEAKGVPTPKVLPAEFDIIEVYMQKYRVIKWVLRFPSVPENGWDIVMVVQPDGFVRTTWPNRWDDLHDTLDRTRYTKPTF